MFIGHYYPKRRIITIFKNLQIKSLAINFMDLVIKIALRQFHEYFIHIGKMITGNQSKEIHKN